MAADPQALHWAKTAALAADEKQGVEIVAFDVSEQLAISEIFLLVSAASERQVGAIVDAVEEALRGEGVKPIRREGDRQNRWVLLDYGEIVAHVQHAEERSFYALERLWRDCPQLDLELPTGSKGDAAE
ncbi:ribosome silencing factor [Naumannella halotolerans]|uniref:Ribosomal silencing factor RsfS n=1 Tax=Naumannella halotolerans TaxID=993414 RepID=A0A4R7J8Y3_9ACTN|nr:ribosome silencing factor [Naumannella halotolerans]TDT33972.1 ribosome-associated protein [Naumannella halotolerans]